LVAVNKRKRRVLRDREVIELLHSDPELLAIADAIGATNSAVAPLSLRLRRPWLWLARRRPC
jgi:hypothetical protein